MNSFVLDGAVFRKRSGRLSLTTRNTEPPRKKIRRRDDGGAAPLPRDLEKSNPRMYGESSASQSAIGATEKESRYSNIEFKRAQAFLYLNYKKISPQNINKLLKEHLKQFDENETQLKKIFEQCYDLTGCVEKSKAMMKQLETVPCLRLGLGTNLSSEVSNRILSISPCKVSRKNVKIVKQTKDKKSMPIRLKKKIEKKIIQCFGKDHYKNDRKILFSKIINDYTKTHNTDYNSDTTTISDTEIDETDNFCRLTKCFRVSVTEIDSLEGNEVTEPNTDSIALGHSSLLSNPQLNTDVNVQNAEGFALWTNIDLEKIMFPRLVIDECSHNSSDTNIDVEEITVSRLIIDECSQNASDTNIDTENITVSRLIIDEGVQNAKDSQLKTNTDVEAITFPQLIIDECSQNASETNIDTEDITVSRLIIDECSQNASDTNIDTENITVSRLIIDEGMQNTKDSPLKTNTDVEAITFPQLIIDECSQNATETNIDTEDITVSRLIIDECSQNASDTNIDTEDITVSRLIIDECSQNASDTNIDMADITVSRLIIDEGVQNTIDSALKTNTDVEAITFPQLIIDECSQNASETNIDTEDITVSRLIIDEGVQNAKDSQLKTNTDVEAITFPQLIIDECSQNASETNIDTEDITVSRLIIDECSQNASDTNIDTEDFAVSRLIIDECSQNASDTNIDTEDFAVSRLIIDEGVQNAKDSPLKTKTDVEAITFPQLIIDECSHANSIINNGEIINLALEKYTSTQDLASSHINALKIDTDIADSKKPSEILDHTNIELKIRKILNPDDNVFNNSIIKDLATYFLNNDFLSKVDVLWKTTESKLVEELIIKLLNMFNSTKYNMALFTGCVICIFREIAQKSSFPPRQMKFKLILLLDAIKKYIKFHDNELWRNWFLPIMFFDWCFIVACIFMNSKNQFKIDLNKSVIRNATAYYKMVKRCKYLFIDQNSKTIKNIGVFELSRIDDLLEFDGVHATNDTTEIPDIPSNELERKKLETDDNYMDTIDLTLPENIEEVCPAPVYPKISVRPEFMYSNSFIKKSNWFTGPVSEILKKWSISMTNGSFKSSTVQNNSTVIVNNEEPSSVNKRRSATNKPTKNKKSKTGFESPRVFFTIANNPTEFDITYGSPSIPQMSSSSEVAQMSSSSVVPQMSSSSVVSQANLQITSSLGVPKTSSLSAISQMSSLSAISQMSSLSAISQMSSLSAISQMSSSSAISQMSSSSVALQNVSSSAVSQNLSPYYNNFSSNNTDSQLPVTPIPRNLSIYYNNIVPDTQVPSGLQSIVNTSQLSNARVTNPPVEKNITSTLHSHYSNIQPSIHHQHSTAMNSQLPKAANTWPLNLYSNLCSDPSYSKSSTSHTDYINSAPSYPQSQYNHYIPPATLYPRHSNALTYPLNYIPTSSDLLTNTTAMVSSVNSYMEHQNYIYGNSCLSQNNFHNTDHNTQVSPDLPDARLPNMPNHQDSNTLKKTCMAANCTNTSNLSCNNCMVAFYCCAKCQKSDWHYHQNECRHSF